MEHGEIVKYADAFCGLGGFSLAMKSMASEGIQGECVWAIDFDKNAAATFLANFGVNPYGDIRKIDIGNIPEHDILFGGFPCQPFSRNGKWFNKNDRTIDESETRENLFLELARILSAKQPKYFILENVVGLLTMKNKDGTSCFDTIVASLRDCGYAVYTKVLDAADYGLPQQRRRIFFVGIRSGLIQDFKFPMPSIRKVVIGDILMNYVDSKYLITNMWKARKLIVARPEMANHKLTAGDSRIDAIIDIYQRNFHKTWRRSAKIEADAILYGDTPSGLPRQQDKIYSSLGISPTIATFSTPFVTSYQGIRQLTPRECARLQGIPDTFILPDKDSVAIKQIGNSVALTGGQGYFTRIIQTGGKEMITKKMVNDWLKQNSEMADQVDTILVHSFQ